MTVANSTSKYLRDAIESRHPGITPSANSPLGIKWDYYGTLAIQQSPLKTANLKLATSSTDHRSPITRH